MRTREATTISRSNYLALVGLVTLAGRSNRTLRDLASAAQEITGDEPDGLTGDAVYSAADDLGADPAGDVDRLLANLNVTVAD